MVYCVSEMPCSQKVSHSFHMVKVAADFALLVAVNVAGVLYYYLAELAQRKTFSETRCYIRSLVNIDEQRRKQVGVAVSGCGHISSAVCLLSHYKGLFYYKGLFCFPHISVPLLFPTYLYLFCSSHVCTSSVPHISVPLLFPTYLYLFCSPHICTSSVCTLLKPCCSELQ